REGLGTSHSPVRHTAFFSETRDGPPAGREWLGSGGEVYHPRPAASRRKVPALPSHCRTVAQIDQRSTGAASTDYEMTALLPGERLRQGPQRIFGLAEPQQTLRPRDIGHKAADLLFTLR